MAGVHDVNRSHAVRSKLLVHSFPFSLLNLWNKKNKLYINLKINFAQTKETIALSKLNMIDKCARLTSPDY